MRRLLLFLALALLPGLAGAYQYDARLSAKLRKDFEKKVSATETGRELLGRLAKTPGYAALKILVRKDDSDIFAWFDPEDNAVYLNSRFILKFFAAKKFRDAKVVEILWNNKEVRAELVKYINPVYLHELVHALQCYLYPEYRQDAGANPLEFEYEAYLTEDMHVHELMKADPVLLRAFIRGTYTDLYTAAVFGSYFTLSLDPGKYREKIRRYYEEGLGGYVSMEKAAVRKQNSVADSKIFAYASGQVGAYVRDNTSLARLRKEKADYARFLDDFYKKRWPVFSADALLFLGELALKEKNYPLALDCLAVADANSAGSGLAPEALNSLKTKGALAILEAASFVRDASRKMDIEVLSQHLKALEKACAATGRPFPEDLRPLLEESYPRAMAYYARKQAGEADPSKKDYYRENLDYFSSRAHKEAGLPE
ncbi:MAG TPA: hypothetical protein DEQ38_05765 [Elusimicrobia bacterium]|nr:MAG: hypothetical protein A2089_06540 [Elusimicrobia bacterium GWD2_63_28]HCC47608.1 hypothetical protein [Elusimicrobiota bacterium]